MKKKIIIVVVLIITLLIGFTINSFATDISTEQSIYDDNNEYYLFRWYNNASANFRIYVPEFNTSLRQLYSDNLDVDPYSPIYIDNYDWIINAESYGYDTSLNNLDRLGLITDLDPYVVINSLINTFVDYFYSDDYSQSIPQYSKCFAESYTTILEAFNKGYYAFNSAAIDPNSNDDFHDYMNMINNQQLEYYDPGFDFFTGSLKCAFWYTQLLSKDYYDIDGNKLNPTCYLGMNNLFRDKLCYSVFNFIYYELGITTITWQDVQDSVWYNTFYGINGNYTGNLCKLSGLGVSSTFVMTGRDTMSYYDVDGITGVARFINGLDYSDVLSELGPFSNYIGPIGATVSILFACTIILAVRKVVLG